MKKLMNITDYENQVNAEARRLAKMMGIAYSATGKNLKERYYFVKGAEKRWNNIAEYIPLE